MSESIITSGDRLPPFLMDAGAFKGAAKGPPFCT